MNASRATGSPGSDGKEGAPGSAAALPASETQASSRQPSVALAPKTSPFVSSLADQLFPAGACRGTLHAGAGQGGSPWSAKLNPMLSKSASSQTEGPAIRSASKIPGSNAGRVSAEQGSPGTRSPEGRSRRRTKWGEDLVPLQHTSNGHLPEAGKQEPCGDVRKAVDQPSEGSLDVQTQGAVQPGKGQDGSSPSLQKGLSKDLEAAQKAWHRQASKSGAHGPPEPVAQTIAPGGFLCACLQGS